MGDVTESEGEASVVILLYYKMKFEPPFHRDTTLQFFRKKGIRWHGSVDFSLAY